MSQAEKTESARPSEPGKGKAVLCRIPQSEKNKEHEKQRTYNTLHGLHRALAAAEADIIARKGPDWNKAVKA